MSLMVYPKVLFRPISSIKVRRCDMGACLDAGWVAGHREGCEGPLQS